MGNPIHRICAKILPFALISALGSIAGSQDIGVVSQPNLSRLRRLVEPPQVYGLAYNGNEVWGVISHGRAKYAIFDNATGSWRLNNEKTHHAAISEAAGRYKKPGGACFDRTTLWIAGSYGDSIACIDTNTWKVLRSFNGTQRDDEGGQSYSGIAHDGKHLWVAWHWFNYELPASKTQLLLKMNPETGDVVSEYHLPPGTPNDGTHGLTWDGTQLWHIKDTRLSAIDPTTGKVTAQHTLRGLERPSGLAWAGDSLFIAEHSGDLWRLPFSTRKAKSRR